MKIIIIIIIIFIIFIYYIMLCYEEKKMQVQPCIVDTCNKRG